VRPEIEKINDWINHWEVVIRLHNGHRTYRLKSVEECPDELSAYMAVARELDKEQTNGSDT
jgi:hypothetical protein